MGKKGPSRHLKREMSPKFWPIHRKEHVWTVKTNSGPHAFKESMPLLVVVRDLLGYAKTGKEAKMLIKDGKVLVDGKPRRDECYPTGLMDIVELPDAEQMFRVLPAKGGRMKLHPIKGGEAGFKLCRIVGKTIVKGEGTQVNLHDGRNIIPPDDDETQYKVNDVIQLKVPEQEILGHVSFEQGVHAIITGGRSQGVRGLVTGFWSEPGKKQTATIRTTDGEDVRTLVQYLFAVGSKEPLISLPGGQ